jgi:hypothetical protein
VCVCVCGSGGGRGIHEHEFAQCLAIRRIRRVSFAHCHSSTTAAYCLRIRSTTCTPLYRATILLLCTMRSSTTCHRRPMDSWRCGSLSLALCASRHPIHPTCKWWHSPSPRQRDVATACDQRASGGTAQSKRDVTTASDPNNTCKLWHTTSSGQRDVDITTASVGSRFLFGATHIALLVFCFLHSTVKFILSKDGVSLLCTPICRSFPRFFSRFFCVCFFPEHHACWKVWPCACTYSSTRSCPMPHCPNYTREVNDRTQPVTTVPFSTNMRWYPGGGRTPMTVCSIAAKRPADKSPATGTVTIHAAKILRINGHETARRPPPLTIPTNMTAPMKQ